MRMQLIVVVAVCGLAASASAILAAPEQTQQPGQMTQANVWVRNRGKGEAIPVNLSDVALDSPLRVRVLNGRGTTPGDDPVNVRVIPQPTFWEYQTIVVKPEQDLAQALNTRGVAGWETTGVALTSPQGTTVLLKRLR